MKNPVTKEQIVNIDKFILNLNEELLTAKTAKAALQQLCLHPDMQEKPISPVDLDYKQVCLTCGAEIV